MGSNFAKELVKAQKEGAYISSYEANIGEPNPKNPNRVKNDPDFARYLAENGHDLKKFGIGTEPDFSRLRSK